MRQPETLQGRRGPMALKIVNILKLMPGASRKLINGPMKSRTYQLNMTNAGCMNWVGGLKKDQRHVNRANGMNAMRFLIRWCAMNVFIVRFAGVMKLVKHKCKKKGCSGDVKYLRNLARGYLRCTTCNAVYARAAFDGAPNWNG